MTEKNDRLNKLLEKKQQIDNQIASIKARERKEEEKKELRKKIIIGEYFLGQYKDKEDELKKMIDSFLKRDSDRLLFRLPPLEREEKENE